MNEATDPATATEGSVVRQRVQPAPGVQMPAHLPPPEARPDAMSIIDVLRSLEAITPYDPNTRQPCDTFWLERPWLTHVLKVATERQLPEWFLLGAVLARAGASIPTTAVTAREAHLVPQARGSSTFTETSDETAGELCVVVEDLRRGWRLAPLPSYGPLSLFVALVGPPGAGKSSVIEAAETVLYNESAFDNLNGRDLSQLRIVSGEAIAANLVMREKEAVYTPTGNPGEYQKATGVQNGFQMLMVWDESTTLDKQMARPGNTLRPMLTSAWSGQNPSTHNASVERYRDVPLDYAASAIVAVQPGTCPALTADTETGFAQRMLFFPGAHDENDCSALLHEAQQQNQRFDINAPARREFRVPAPPLIADDDTSYFFSAGHQPVSFRRRHPGTPPSLMPSAAIRFTLEEARRRAVSSREHETYQKIEEEYTDDGLWGPTEDELFSHGEHTYQLASRLANIFAFMGHAEDYSGWDSAADLQQRGVTDDDWRLALMVLSVSKQTHDMQVMYLQEKLNAEHQQHKRVQADIAQSSAKRTATMKANRAKVLLWQLARSINRQIHRLIDQHNGNVPTEELTTGALTSPLGTSQKAELVALGIRESPAAAGREAVAYAAARKWIVPVNTDFVMGMDLRGIVWNLGPEEPPPPHIRSPLLDPGFDVA